MSTKILPSRSVALAAAALLTVVFVVGCQSQKPATTTTTTTATSKVPDRSKSGPHITHPGG